MMMFYFLVIFFIYMFFISNHPLFSMFIMIMVSFIVCFFLMKMSKNSWLSVSIIILISSGMLLVFAYVSNIVPNPKILFIFSLKVNLFFFIMFLYFFLIFFDFFWYWVEGSGYVLDSIVYYYMMYEFGFFMVFFMVILVGGLFSCIKMVMKFEGPMRF